MSLLARFEFGPNHLFVFSAIVCVVLFVEAGYLLLAAGADRRNRVNRRVALSNAKNKVSQRDVLVQLRKERGMDAEGRFVLPLAWLNRIVVQAGMTGGLARLAAWHGAFVVFSLLFVAFLTRSAAIIALAFPVVAFLVPVIALRMRRAGKLARFGRQLPEAIDLITRSLKAGHPVPVAVAMVAREMPDPIGTEFGMVADEVTYGSDLVTALGNLFERVGHPDLPLLVSSVSIQSTTGGNLREILEGLSKVVRDRLKMKAKIRAISAEGRMSAIFLSAMPVMLFAVLLLLIPDYYGGVWRERETWIGFAGLGFWLVSGNLLIMKIVSFKV
jgi:tight adherence protein B